jgi:hypothetical protein
MLKPGDPPLRMSAEIAGLASLKLVVHTDGSTKKLAFPLWGNALFLK